MPFGGPSSVGLEAHEGAAAASGAKGGRAAGRLAIFRESTIAKCLVFKYVVDHRAGRAEGRAKFSPL